MHFLIDQDVYFSTITLLREWGNDVVTAKELNMARAKDVELLLKAKELNRIFITRDKDFGALVFLREINNGVILLRMTPSTIEETHKELEYLLNEHTEEELNQYFSVVEPNRHRIRKFNK
jgi:predicted nuclease of predicted toxin-antitoxin system